MSLQKTSQDASVPGGIDFCLRPGRHRNQMCFKLTKILKFFSVNFQVSTFNESHHFLVKLSCESVCENLDAILVSARSAVCFFQPTLQLSKESSWPSLWLRFLYLHASDVHQHTFNRSRVATLTPEVGLQNLRACKRGSGQFLSDWLTYAIDNINVRVTQCIWKILALTWAPETLGSRSRPLQLHIPA